MIFKEYLDNLEQLLDLVEKDNDEKGEAIKALVNEITIKEDIQQANIEKCFVINIKQTPQEEKEYFDRLHSICERLFDVLNYKGKQDIVDSIKNKLLKNKMLNFKNLNKQKERQ